jgi:hypothetical protein
MRVVKDYQGIALVEFKLIEAQTTIINPTFTKTTFQYER